ncbi:hypothetical protein PFISCL1PPCAC_24532, partial [Pristionchus fissidentatus]
QPHLDYPRQNLQHVQPLQPTQFMQQQLSQVLPHNNGRNENSSSVLYSNFTSTTSSFPQENQNNYYPMQQITITDSAARPELQQLRLPHDWKPYGSCGISNEIWTHVIFYSLLSLSLLDMWFTFRNAAPLIVLSYEPSHFLWSMISCTRSILLFVASFTALIHIQQRKTTGLSFLLGVLFLFHIVNWILLLLEIIAMTLFLCVLLIIRGEDRNDCQSLVMTVRHTEEEVKDMLMLMLFLSFFLICFTVIGLVIIQLIRKVLFDFRETMKLNGAR